MNRAAIYATFTETVWLSSEASGWTMFPSSIGFIRVSMGSIVMVGRNFACLATFLITVSFTVISTAQEIPKETRHFFERLAGEWEIISTRGDTTMKDTLTAKVTTPNGEGIIWHWSGTDIDSGQAATAVGLMGWDGQKRVVVENMISSNGVTFSGTWSGSGNRWTGKTRGMELMDGEYKTSFDERVMEWESNDRMVIVSKGRLLSGKPQPVVTSVFERKK